MLRLLVLFLLFVGAYGACYDGYGTIDENGHLDIIPAAAGGQPDTTIGWGYAVYGTCDPSLKSLFIPNTITKINQILFKGATDLETVTFQNNPNSVTQILGSAFENSGLTSITFPDSVTLTQTDWFEGTSLNSIDFSNGVSLSLPMDEDVVQIAATPEKVTVTTDGFGVANVDIKAPPGISDFACSELETEWNSRQECLTSCHN